jgi:hypothetical protein
MLTVRAVGREMFNKPIKSTDQYGLLPRFCFAIYQVPELVRSFTLSGFNSIDLAFTEEANKMPTKMELVIENSFIFLCITFSKSSSMYIDRDK